VAGGDGRGKHGSALYILRRISIHCSFYLFSFSLSFSILWTFGTLDWTWRTSLSSLLWLMPVSISICLPCSLSLSSPLSCRRFPLPLCRISCHTSGITLHKRSGIPLSPLRHYLITCHSVASPADHRTELDARACLLACWRMATLSRRIVGPAIIFNSRSAELSGVVFSFVLSSRLLFTFSSSPSSRRLPPYTASTMMLSNLCCGISGA